MAKDNSQVTFSGNVILFNRKIPEQCCQREADEGDRIVYLYRIQGNKEFDKIKESQNRCIN